jgi:alpha-tubulin suppressor-like RCC1 family protein
VSKSSGSPEGVPGGWRRRWGPRAWRAPALAVAAAVGMAAAPWTAAAATLPPALTALSPSYGPTQGGTQVEIEGSGFVGVTGVLFGNASAPFVVESSSVVLASAPPAPPGAGSVAVRVVTSAGTSPSLPFTYVGTPTVQALYPTSGPVAGGTPVVIRGSGFSGATAVDFGAGRPAAFTVVSDTEIEATLPADTVPQTVQRCVRRLCRTVSVAVPATEPLTVDVTVVTPAGSSPAVPADQFTFLPTPSVTGVSPAAGPAAGGTAVSILGSNLGDVQAVTFGGVPAPFQIVSDSQIEATAPPGSGAVPVQVAAGPGVTAVASGGDTAYAILSGGALWQWGLRAPLPASEAASPPPCDCSTLPEAVAGIGPVTAVAAGSDATYALAADGRVWAWGAGTQGQLGDGHLVDSSVPVPVQGLRQVVAIAAGSLGGLALEANGSVWAWGSDIAEQLGSLAAWKDPCLCTAVPVQVPGLPPVRAIAAGALTNYALAADGQVWAWGGGGAGQLGSGQPQDLAPPRAVPDLSGVVQLVAGGDSAYALGADGTVWAWGDDASGQLGQLAVTPEAGCACVASPVQVLGLPAGVSSLAAGSASAYALTSQGTVWAWGDNAYGELGPGATAPASASGTAPLAAAAGTAWPGGPVCSCVAVPAQVGDLGDVSWLAAGGHDAFAWTASGVLEGWGAASRGQLGPAATAAAQAAPVTLPFWSDMSAADPNAMFTYVGAVAGGS